MRNLGQNGEELSVYELCFLVLPSIPEDKLPDTTTSVSEAIAKEGGKELDSETPFKYPLSYSMSKTVGASRYVVSEAYLGWVKFEIEPGKISTVKASVEKINEILRFLLVKTPRETTFTFAKAKALAKERERAKESEEEATPSPTEEAVVN